MRSPAARAALRPPPRGRRRACIAPRSPARARAPCRRSRRRRPARRARSRGAIARARSGSTSGSPLAPARISSMIARGSSLRGLSEVTIATSASSVGDRGPSAGACRGRGRRRSRRRRSRGRRASSRAVAQDVLERARLVGVVDDRPRTAVPRRPTRTGRGRRRPRRSRAAIASSARPSSRAAATAPSTFSTLKRPRELQSMPPSTRRRRGRVSASSRRRPYVRSGVPARAAPRRAGAVRVADVDGRRRRARRGTAAASRRSSPPCRRGSRGGPGSRFVKTRAAKRTRSRRPSAEPCEVASIAQLRSPASSISRNRRWRSIASAVVRVRRPRARRRRGSRSCRAGPGRRPAAARTA